MNWGNFRKFFYITWLDVPETVSDQNDFIRGVTEKNESNSTTNLTCVEFDENDVYNLK